MLSDIFILYDLKIPHSGSSDLTTQAGAQKCDRSESAAGLVPAAKSQKRAVDSHPQVVRPQHVYIKI